MEKKLPVVCPSCENALFVRELKCEQCETAIQGHYDLPALLQLSAKDQQFILDFVKASGSLKALAEQMKLSYPTVRNMLDDLIEKLN